METEQEALSPLAKATQVVSNGSRIPRSQTDFKAGTPNLQAILSLSTGSFPAKGLDFVLSLAQDSSNFNALPNYYRQVQTLNQVLWVI